jgi:hypothetical protein
MEKTLGVNQPCEVCDLTQESSRRLAEELDRLNFKLHKAQESDTRRYPCAWCGRETEIDFTGFTASERELFERLHAVYYAGTHCAPENATLLDEIRAACERAERERYGQHYDVVRNHLDEYKRNMADLTDRMYGQGITPRHHYLCRVEGCLCNYPKTEAEYEANKRELMRLAA